MGEMMAFASKRKLSLVIAYNTSNAGSDEHKLECLQAVDPVRESVIGEEALASITATNE